MADEPPPEAMIDQPGVAVRAGEPVAAAAAERERRKAAAVEEQQRLLAALDRGLHRLGEPRRDEAPARRALALRDRSPRCRADAGRRSAPAAMQLLVAAAPRVHFGLDRRRRRRQHDRDAADARAHHRHVAGVIAHAVLLLVGGVVLLIDDDQAEIGVRQEQRRARADRDRRLARRHRRPGARRSRCESCECHSAGRTPKRSAKRSSTCEVSAISGIRISACRPRRMVSATASR